MHAPSHNTGLPVPAALALIERWTDLAAQWEADVKYYQRPAAFKDDPSAAVSAAVSAAICQARVNIYTVCIQDLRTELARITPALRST